MTKKIRVLIFPCGAENALELHEALSSCVNVEVWGASGQADHGQHLFRNYIGDLPYIQAPSFLSALNEILQSHKIDLIFPTHDTVAEFFADHRHEIQAKIVMAEEQTAKICREKSLIYKCFSDCQFSPQLYASLEEVQEYPVFAKPNIGEGGRNTQLLTSRVEAEHALASHSDLLLVEYLPGTEYTVDCLTDRHGALRFIGPRERSRIFSGISAHSRSVALTQEVEEIAAEINRRLHFRGLWFFQLKRSAKGTLKLLEISTRVAGTMAVSRYQGVNLPLLSVYDALDMDVEIVQNHFSVEVDRALFNRFCLKLDYEAIYLDFDDTLVCQGRVNRPVLLLLYQAQEQGKKVHLLTRHEGEIQEALQAAYIDARLFATIQQIGWEIEKHTLLARDQKAIYIDNSFAERKKVSDLLGIPVFDVDAVPALLDWRN